MDTTMELDELKQAWQALGRQMERQEAIQWQLLRERRLDRVRRGMWPLVVGQVLQFVLGVGLVVLGVACWTRNTDVPGLFASGLLVHAFGVATAVFAAITLVLLGTVDYSAPVLKIQKRMTLLRRFYGLNALLCGLPWWIMWLPVVVAFAGLDAQDPAAGTPAWVRASLAISVAGLLATAGGAWILHRRARAAGRGGLLDESPSLRRGAETLDEIAGMERDRSA